MNEKEILKKFNLDVLSKANLSGANLSKADLRDADLNCANLSRADLRGADLRGANLKFVDLRGADLRGANLSEANLSWANLSGDDLSEANLRGTIGNMKEVFSMQLKTYHITFTKDILCIGCKQYTHEQWMGFSDDEIADMDRNAAIFWKKWKDHIFATIKLVFED